MIAMRYVAAATVLGLLLAGCSTHVPYRNERPAIPFPDASNLIPKCAIAVRFNEDEASVPESDYLDAMGRPTVNLAPWCLPALSAVIEPP